MSFVPFVVRSTPRPAASTTQGISALSDTFTGLVLDASKWVGRNIGGNQTVGQNNAALVTPDGSLPAENWVAMTSVDAYRLTGDAAVVQLVQRLQTDGNDWGYSETHFRVMGATHYEGYGIHIEKGGTLIARGWRRAGDRYDLGSVAGIADGVWLRIREAAGTVYCEYALDNAGSPGTWTLIGSSVVTGSPDFVDSAAFLAGCKPELRAGYWSDAMEAAYITGPARFDNFNPVSGTTAVLSDYASTYGVAGKVSSDLASTYNVAGVPGGFFGMSDAFTGDGAIDSAIWQFDNDGSGYAVREGGVLKFGGTATGAYQTLNYLTSKYVGSFVGKESTIRVVKNPTVAGNPDSTNMSFLVVGDTHPYSGNQQYFGFFINSANVAYMLGANAQDALFLNQTITYDAATMAWLRLRESGGTCYLETAPDSNNAPGAWTVRWSFATSLITSWSLSAARMHLRGRVWGDVSTLEETVTRFDSLNQTVAATTQVTSDLASTYVVNSRVLKDHAATYTVNSRVLMDFAASWVGRARVTSDLVSSAAVAARVTSDLSVNWVGRAQVASDFAASFSSNARILRDLASTYTTNARVLADLASTYTVNARLFKDLSTSWVGNARVTSDFSASAVVANRVTSDFSASWVQRQRITQDQGGSYTVRSAVAADYAASYTLRNSVAKDLASSFVVHARVSADYATAYTTAQRVTSDIGSTFVVNGRVFSDFTGSVAGNNQVTSDLSSSYQVQARMASDYGSAYVVRAPVQSDLAGTFLIRGQVASSLAGTYTVRAQVARDLVGSYTVSNRVANDFAATYTTNSRVLKDLSTSYAVQARVAGDMAASYAVMGRVLGDLSSSYGVIARVGATSGHSYQVTGRVVSDFNGASGAAGIVVSDGSFAYQVQARVVSDLGSSYAARSTVASDYSGSYAVRARVLADLGSAYQTAQRITSIFAGSWTTSQHVISDLGAVYPVTHQVHADLASVYEVLARITPPVVIEPPEVIHAPTPSTSVGGYDKRSSYDSDRMKARIAALRNANVKQIEVEEADGVDLLALAQTLIISGVLECL